MNKTDKKMLVRRIVAKEKSAAIRLSDTIADLAEPGFKEFQSSKNLAEYLEERGFRVSFPWGDMPTAFKADWGKGKPLIGFLAEYDALPNCGKKPGTWGHGCGHNLLGVAAAAGAVAAKGFLETLDLKGKIVLWGCPAEELLAGKVYMARDGAFRNHDAILAWHPGIENVVNRKGGSALDSILFEFLGQTAHGAFADKGRSALDGVMLLDVAANYLREHIPENVRIHMCILDGGDAPNVVPGYAKSWYYVRGKNREQVDKIRHRLMACAKGAAMATDTRVKTTRLTGGYSRLENDVLADQVLKNLKTFGAPRATPKDLENVKKLGKKPRFNQAVSDDPGKRSRATSDEDTVSWLAPFGSFSLACVSQEGVGIHHRDWAAQMKLPFAHRSMIRAAEIFAGTAFDLFTDAKLLKKARVEFETRTKDFVYDPLVPKRQKPSSITP